MDVPSICLSEMKGYIQLLLRDTYDLVGELSDPRLINGTLLSLIIDLRRECMFGLGSVTPLLEEEDINGLERCLAPSLSEILF
jgi:hypothetical protein